MQVIKDLLGNYVAIKHGKLTKVSDIGKAHTFSNGQAQNYINTQIKKKERDTYIVEDLTVDKVVKPPIAVKFDIEKPELDCVAIITSIRDKTYKSYEQLRNHLQKELKKCDTDILDYRHFMRDESTILNAVQLCKAGKVCQDLERKREKVKKELMRCNFVLESADELVENAKSFEYQSYNPRGSIDFNKIIKG